MRAKSEIHVDYYEKEYKAYFNKTVSLDPSLFLETFIQKINKGAMILDIGCGSGRDIKWLKERGFDAVGLERSAGLASLARQYSGCRVIEADFETFDFSNFSADGMLMTGSLVHLHWDKFEETLQHIIKGLKPEGIIYISLKKADENIYIENRRISIDQKSGHNHIKRDATGIYSDSKRQFYMWKTSDLEDIFFSSGLEILHFSETQSLLKTNEIWLGYLMINKKMIR